MNIIVAICKKIISKLEPDTEIELPKEKLNYHKAVDSILSQTLSGRKAFYGILLSRANDDDKHFIFDYLKKKLKKNEPEPKERTREERTSETTRSSVRVPRKVIDSTKLR